MNHDVFISYSSKNSTAAQAICHELEDKGIKCWMAPRDIPGGKEYGDLIDDAILSCSIFLLVYSADSLVSKWCKGELNVAFSEGKTIIPYRIDATPLKGAMRIILNQTHWIEAYPDYKVCFNDLVTVVAQALEKTISAAENVTRKVDKITDSKPVGTPKLTIFKDLAGSCEKSGISGQVKKTKESTIVNSNSKLGVIMTVSKVGALIFWSLVISWVWVASKRSLETFNSKMENADQVLAQGKYVEAREAYLLAYEEYRPKVTAFLARSKMNKHVEMLEESLNEEVEKGIVIINAMLEADHGRFGTASENLLFRLLELTPNDSRVLELKDKWMRQ